MIYEVATIEVVPGSELDFEAVVRNSMSSALAARGCRSVELYRTLEQPRHYMLRIGWDTLEDHVVHFRGSEAFARWREAITPLLARPPEVVHTEHVIVDRAESPRRPG